MINYNINYLRQDKYPDFGVLDLKTPPTERPITLAQAKSFLRIDSDYDDDDAYITSLIDVAVGVVEEFTRRRLCAQTYRIFYSEFVGDYIDLQIGKVSIINHVKYRDVDGVTQTLPESEYEFAKYIYPNRIYLSPDGSFPNTYDSPNSIEVEFVVGGAAATIPSPIIQAIYIIVGRYYENRQDVVTGTIASELPLMVDHLLTPYRLLEL